MALDRTASVVYICPAEQIALPGRLTDTWNSAPWVTSINVGGGCMKIDKGNEPGDELEDFGDELSSDYKEEEAAGEEGEELEEEVSYEAGETTIPVKTPGAPAAPEAPRPAPSVAPKPAPSRPKAVKKAKRKAKKPARKKAKARRAKRVRKARRPAARRRRRR
jgi:outer membrane biosynthesis protein TonB